MSEETPNGSGLDEIGVLMHDIRSGIHALKMGRECLKRMYDDPQLHDVCGAMETEEQKVLDLLSRLTAVARRKNVIA